MPLAFINGKALYFSHIPKCGGTSVEAYLQSKGRLYLQHPERVKWAKTTPQHMALKVADAFVKPDQVDHRFAVVRDPVKRFVSAFRWRVEPVERPEDSEAPEWAQHFLVPIRQERVVRTFDQWVEEVFAWADENGNWIYDNHILRQNQFVAEDMKIFRLEDGLTPVYRWIDEVTGTEAAEDVYVNESAKIPVTMMRKTFKSIVRRYRKDYEMLGDLYTRPTLKDFPPGPITM